MRYALGPLTLAALLVGAGAVLWTTAAREEARAEALRALVTFRYEQAGDSAAVAYWKGDYTDLAADREPLLAANAAYRAAMRDGGDWRAVTTRLDGVIKQYADVLRADPVNADAAYNYEFVVRYRAAIAARQQRVAPDTTYETLTMHGRAGAPPQGSDGKQFKMLVPMRPDERQEAEEAGRNQKRIRKG